jgi:hypothetical protein
MRRSPGKDPGAEWWLKSKRRWSGATSEPCCLTCGPSTFRRAQCSGWVPVWLRRMASRWLASMAAVAASRGPMVSHSWWHAQLF